MRFDSQALHDAREEQHLSVADLAIMANVSLTTVRRLERGTDENPQVGTVTKIAQVLDVPVVPTLIHE